MARTAATPRRLLAVPVAVALLTSGCGGWGGGVGGGGGSLNVLMVNNLQMVDLQRLTGEHFTKRSARSSPARQDSTTSPR